jgi:hypothetical protein
VGSTYQEACVYSKSQRWLVRRRLSAIAIDGLYGQRTRSATAVFHTQRRATGYSIADRATWHRMQRAATSVATLEATSSAVSADESPRPVARLLNSVGIRISFARRCVG